MNLLRGDLRRGLLACLAALGVLGVSSAGAAPRWMEALDRGAVAVPAIAGGNLVSWRLLATDAPGTAFDVYRDGRKVNARPLTGATNLVDPAGTAQSTYVVRTRVKGKVVDAAKPAAVLAEGFLAVPIQPPPGGVTPSGEAYTYTAHEASVGDLDGDGRYEIILKWDPGNARDNAFDGYTGEVWLDAYTLDGNRLWRINLGCNIRAGAHYTQFQVFDYDGDGRAAAAPVRHLEGGRPGHRPDRHGRLLPELRPLGRPV